MQFSTRFSVQETRSMGTRGAGSGLDFCLRLSGSELGPPCLFSSTAYSEDPDRMSALIEFVAWLEVHAPDGSWMGLLKLIFVRMIVFAEGLGVLAPWETARVLELSVLPADLVSIRSPGTSAAPPWSGQTSRNRDSQLSSAGAQDASE